MAKIKFSDMQKLSELENKLSKSASFSRTAESIPKDSPLGREVEAQKKALGGDLDGLPPGHPLIKMIEEAKKRFEQQENERNSVPTESSSKKASVIRNGEAVPAGMRKISPVNRTAASAEDREGARVVAAHKVNRAIEKADEVLLALMREITDNEDIINTEHVGKMKLYRLKRMVDAMRRLFGDSRIPGARA